jgi:cytochrome c oxidase assembly protein Cox11
LPSRRFRPLLECLEDRALPSTATHFLVQVPQAAQVVQSASVNVVALDDSNHVATSYSGTVQLSSTDSSTTVPSAYTFTTADHGHHTFTITPGTTGTETISATDTSNSSITGSASLLVNAAPVVTHFLVLASSSQGSTDHHCGGQFSTDFTSSSSGSVSAGAPTNIRVLALDASNHVVPTYTGTVQLSSTDSSTTVPAAYTFTTADQGAHTFSVTPGTTGTETITATDTSDSSITGSVSLTVNPAPVATHFQVIVPQNAQVGQSAPVKVVALDASNHIVSNYTGTVQLSSSDTAATLPASYTFLASDAGSHVFSVIFGTTGSQTVTATDTSNSSLTGSATTSVGQASASLVDGESGSNTAGGLTFGHHHHH